MSVSYPSHIYTAFPDDISVRDYVHDLDISTKVYYDQYCTYINQSKFTEANEIKENYLKNVLVDAFFFNGIIDDIYALQKLFHDELESWVFNVSKYAGVYSSTVKYTKFNVVSYVHEAAIQFYQAVALDIPIGTLPTDENYWMCVTMRGEKGDPGMGMSYAGIWNNLTNYSAEQFVVCNNAFWICLTQNSGSQPSKTNPKWGLMLEISANLFVYDTSNSFLTSTTMQGAIDELDHNMRLFKSITLLAANWTSDVSNTGPYSQTVSVDGLTENENPILVKNIPSNYTPAQVKEYNKAIGMIDGGTTSNGQATFICYNKKPSVDLIVGLKGL